MGLSALLVVFVCLADLNAQLARQAVLNDHRWHDNEVKYALTLCLMLSKDRVGAVVGPDYVLIYRKLFLEGLEFELV